MIVEANRVVGEAISGFGASTWDCPGDYPSGIQVTIQAVGGSNTKILGNSGFMSADDVGGF
jgi:hypothetical protein